MSRVAYNRLIVEIRANIYFPTVTSTHIRRRIYICIYMPRPAFSSAIPKARRIAYPQPTKASEKYDSWMHSSRGVCIPRCCYRIAFIYVSPHSCARSQEQIKTFSQVRPSFLRGEASARGRAQRRCLTIATNARPVTHSLLFNRQIGPFVSPVSICHVRMCVRARARLRT